VFQETETNDRQMLSPNKLPPLTGIERAARFRERRKAGYRCFLIEVHRSEISGLVRNGLLCAEQTKDREAVIAAIYAHFEQTLGPIPSATVPEPREFKEHFG
jgi:hypothetical protein